MANSIAPLITSPNSTTFTVGAPGTFTVTATGSPTPTLSESGALPSGVTFNSSTGVLSGTPAAGSSGSYSLSFTASNGVSPSATQSFTLTVLSVGVQPQAIYGGADTTTQGSWQKSYGADGYSLAGGAQSLPSYDQSFAVSNATIYTWAKSTSDPRALQTGGTGLAACWYKAGTFSFDVNLTDGNTHQVALYALDWDMHGRGEAITVVDANSNAVLDTRTISNFTGGVYLYWSVSGHVKINVTWTAGANAVISGVFFGL